MDDTLYTVLRPSGEPEAEGCTVSEAASVVLNYDGGAYEIRRAAAKYAKGRVVMRCPPDDSGMKTRAARLAEAFGGRWVGRSRGYNMSPRRASAALEAWIAGYDAHIRMFASDKRRTAELLISPERFTSDDS